MVGASELAKAICMCSKTEFRCPYPLVQREGLNEGPGGIPSGKTRIVGNRSGREEIIHLIADCINIEGLCMR